MIRQMVGNRLKNTGHLTHFTASQQRSRLKMAKFVPAEFCKSAFNCPICGAYAQQYWHYMGFTGTGRDNTPNLNDPDNGCFVSGGNSHHQMRILDGINLSRCSHCGKNAIWLGERLFLPPSINVEPAHEDMPASASILYNEAAEIVDASPRGAAALLRVALEHLTHELECDPKKSINEKIGELVGRGVSSDVINACDVLRVTGNNAAHTTALLLLDDDRETATALFQIINYIVEQTIAQEKRLADMHNRLPENIRLQIDRRNIKALPKGE